MVYWFMGCLTKKRENDFIQGAINAPNSIKNQPKNDEFEKKQH
jgi:hypothetical protein